MWIATTPGWKVRSSTYKLILNGANKNFLLYFSYFSQLNRIQLRALRDASNPFQLPENTFRQTFVLTPNLALDLIDQLKSWDSSNNFESEEVIPFHLKVLSTLHFYGKGSYQVSVGRNNMCNMSQPTVSRCISYISGLIDDHLADQFIKFPTSEDEKRSISAGFQEQFDLNNIIGSIDCTHIAIVASEHIQSLSLLRSASSNTSLIITVPGNFICNSLRVWRFLDKIFRKPITWWRKWSRSWWCQLGVTWSWRYPPCLNSAITFVRYIPENSQCFLLQVTQNSFAAWPLLVLQLIYPISEILCKPHTYTCIKINYTNAWTSGFRYLDPIVFDFLRRSQIIQHLI